MPDRYTFEYAIIRVVPKVEREEFFNVGVILFCKRLRFLGVKTFIDSQKLHALAPEMELEEVAKYLNSWSGICDGRKEGGAIAEFEQSDRFRWLAASRSTIIQSSKTHPGLTEDPEKELEVIFKSYVK